MKSRKKRSATRVDRFSSRRSAFYRPLLELLEDRSLLSTFAVTNTSDSGVGSLRWAINQVNSDSNDTAAQPDIISFALPANDPRHFYYRNNAGAGVSANIVGVTTVDDTGMTPAQTQAAIPDIDPDYLHTWWSISLTTTESPQYLTPYSYDNGDPPVTYQAELPAITGPVVIDGYSQSGAQKNDGLVPGDDAVLRVEINAEALGPHNLSDPTQPQWSGLLLASTASNSRIQGLVLNGFLGADAVNIDGVSGVHVAGNFIGTDVSGTIAPNVNGTRTANESALVPDGRPDYSSLFIPTNVTHIGVRLMNAASGNWIGGTGASAAQDAADRNLISANCGGVHFQDQASFNVLAGNLIGTDRTGTHELGNWIGVGWYGGIHDNQIGTNGTDPDVTGERNIISGNLAGIGPDGFDGANTLNNSYNDLIAGNFIGTDVNGNKGSPDGHGGTYLGNGKWLDEVYLPWDTVNNFHQYAGGSGIDLDEGSLSDTIGSRLGTPDSLVPRLANVIAYNNGPGVTIQHSFYDFYGEPSPAGTTIRGNSIHDNLQLGIDLGGQFSLFNQPYGPQADGVTLNDSSGHSGPNNFQNFPLLTSATSSTAGTTITGTFSEADELYTTLTLDFYANASPGHVFTDGNYYGEGQAYLGSAQVTTDGTGSSNFTVTFSTPVLVGEGYLSATATDSAGNTSEFSPDLIVSASNLVPVTSQSLQALLNAAPVGGVALQAATAAGLSTILTAISQLAPSTSGTLSLNLPGATKYGNGTINAPANLTVSINGNAVSGAPTTIDPAIPALIVNSGRVIVNDVTLTESGDAPTILVTGGSLMLRNDIVQESTTGADPAITVTGGTLDLGTPASPGNNVLNVNGTGTFIRNITGVPVSNVGNTFQINGQVTAWPMPLMVADINPGSVGSQPSELVNFNGTLFFAAGDDGTYGRELWKSDGTPAGTTMVADINPGWGGSAPTNLTVVGNTLFFAAYEGVHGRELWKSDGTLAGTTLVADIRPGGLWSWPSNLTAVNGKLYFSAYGGLWTSDGTAPGTFLVKGFYSITNLLNANGTLFLQVQDYWGNSQLWRSDGTADGTIPIGGIGNMQNLTSVNGAVYFTSQVELGFVSSTPSGFFTADATSLYKVDPAGNVTSLWTSPTYQVFHSTGIIYIDGGGVFDGTYPFYDARIPAA